MCGIAGFVSIRVRHGEQDLWTMANSLVRRGPDDSGVWIDSTQGIFLGHRRLSILDLSQAGHQPMVSSSGRFVIVLNGEIYNFAVLKKLLLQFGHRFNGESDTEVFLAGFEEWGVFGTVERAEGMFAFAVWDRQQRVIVLGRDRMGEKPLYYGWGELGFLFASELKALRMLSWFNAEIDRDALSLFMRYNYIPAPHSIYKKINKLQPGSLLELPLDQLTRAPTNFSPYSDDSSAVFKPKSYWSIRNIIQSQEFVWSQSSDQQVTEHLELTLRSAIRGQMIADVPIGAFLSGGIDSSTVVALMQSESSVPVRTFSIGFFEGEYNEAHHAKRVAEHLRTEHTELYVTAAEAQSVIPKIPTIYDEPFADSSQIPTYLVAKLARQHVTVALSGDGGDELFCGYPRYIWCRNIWRICGGIPAGIRRLLLSPVMLVDSNIWNLLYAALRPFLPQSLSFQDFGGKLHRLATVLGAASLQELYNQLITHWDVRQKLIISATNIESTLAPKRHQLSQLNPIHQMVCWDLENYLPDDLMVKVDRASMAMSLESRAPFLNHNVVDFALNLPLHFTYRDGMTKWILRQVLRKFVPEELFERPKMGFGVPIDHWLRGPLREWAEGLLSEERLRKEGYLHPQLIRQKWSEHLTGKKNWHYLLWDVLMFQAWLEANK